MFYHLPAIINTLLCLFILYWEFKRQSPGVFLWGIITVMWGFPHLLNCIRGCPPFTAETLQTCSIFSILFIVTYIIARVLFSPKKKLFAGFKPTYDSKSANIMFVLLVFFFIYRLYEVYRYSGSLLDATWSSNLEMTSGRDDISIMGQLAGKTAYFLAGLFLIYLTNGKRNLAIVSFVILLVSSLVSRARADLLPILVCVITYYIFLRKKKGKTLKQLLIIAILGFGAIYLVYALQMYRWAGSINDFISDFSFSDFNELVFTMMSSGDGELGLGQYFYLFVQNDNNFEDFGKMHTYLRMLLFWVPTKFSFGLKPDDFAMAMGKACGMDEGETMHPTLLGDCYANLGFMGFMLGFLWGGLMALFDRLVNVMDNRFKLPIFVTIACSLTLIGRGSVYNGFTFMVYICIVVYLIQRMSLKRPATCTPLSSASGCSRE